MQRGRKYFVRRVCFIATGEGLSINLRSLHRRGKFRHGHPQVTALFVFGFSSGGTLSWVADQDYDFINAYSNATSSLGLISTDPSLTAANITTPSSPNKVIENVLWFSGTAAKSNPNVKIPVPKGTTLFVLAGGALSIAMILEIVS